MIRNLSDRLASISKGGSCAVLSSGDSLPGGRVICWGDNYAGQLGVPTSTRDTPSSSAQPAELPADAQIEQIVASASSTCALDRSGRVFCWGGQSDCLLGLGRSERLRAMPALVTFPTGVAIRRLSMGSFIVLAVDATGRLWTWGRGGLWLASNTSSSGSSCDGLRDDAGVPYRAGTLNPVEADWFGSRRFLDVAAGYQHACAIDTDQGVWCWGQVIPLGGSALADSGVDMRVAYVGSLTGNLSCP